MIKLLWGFRRITLKYWYQFPKTSIGRSVVYLNSFTVLSAAVKRPDGDWGAWLAATLYGTLQAICLNGLYSWEVEDCAGKCELWTPSTLPSNKNKLWGEMCLQHNRSHIRTQWQPPFMFVIIVKICPILRIIIQSFSYLRSAMTMLISLFCYNGNTLCFCLVATV